MKKILALFFALMMLLSLAGCGTAPASQPASEPASQPASEPASGADGEETQRYLGIVWPTLGIEFYADFAELMKSQAEEDGWKAEITSFDFDQATQVTQLENFVSMGVTDICTIALDPDGLNDTCKAIREKGIKVHFFAMGPSDLDALDTVTVANQYDIGMNIAGVTSDWVDATFPDAADGSVKGVIIGLPTDAENINRDQGIKDGLAQNSKIDVVKVYDLAVQDNVAAQAAFETAMLENPDINFVCCHFASFALAIDETAMARNDINHDEFALFSGDWDTIIGGRVKSSVNDESLIRGLGAYDNNATLKQFPVIRGDYDDELNDQKQYEFFVMKVTPENVDEYLG